MTQITTTEQGATGRYIVFNQAALDDLGSQTILAYCRPTASGGGGFGYLYGKTPSGTTEGPKLLIEHNSGSPRAFVSGVSTAGGAPSAYSSTNSTPYNSWMHVAGSWDGSINGSGCKTYVGVGATLAEDTATTANGSGTVPSDSANDAYLLNRNGLGREFVGDVAYIALWNVVLTLAQLQNAQANGPLAEPTGLVLLWANVQDFSTNALTPSSRSTHVDGAVPSTYLELGDGDVTAPTLTSPTGTAASATTATGTVSTNEGNGTLYYLASTNATETVSTVKAASSQSVTGTGTQNVSVGSLTASTTYYLHYVHTDAASNDSTVANSASFSTPAASATITSQPLKNNAGTLLASISGWTVNVYNQSTGALVVQKTSLSTDASGVLTITDAALTASTTYAFEAVHATYGRRLPTGTAA